MNHICAKIKSKCNGSKYRSMTSTKNDIYKTKEEMVHSFREYNPDSLLEQGEWYAIKSFSQQEYALDLMKEDYETVDYENLEQDEYKHIDFLFIHSDEALYFQKVGKTRLTKKKNFLKRFGDSFEYVHDADVLTFNEYPDAIYTRADDILYFRKLDKAAGIFKGMIILYREATEPEVIAFLENDFIVLTNGFDASRVKTMNRKRITLATDILSKLEDNEKKEIFSYIEEYCPNLIAESQKFTIGSEADLKMVLYGIEERFYTTPVTQEKRAANSTVELN